jgi:ketosteroid isomerase-like protein
MKKYQLQSNNQIERPAFPSVVILSWSIAFTFMAFLLSSCGGGLGKIRVEDVDTSITDAQIAIQAAYFTSAAKYEPTTLNHAQSLLNDAKKAKEEKKGVEALRLAQSAKFEAELAVSRSQQREATDEEINTLKQEKQAELDAIKNNLQAAELESTKMKLDVQQLESRLEQLESDKRDLVMQLSEQRNADWKAKQAENRVAELEQQLTEIQSQLHSALLKQKETENLAQEFSNKLSQELAVARAEAAEAKKKEKAAQVKSSTRAKDYTAKIDELEREKTREVALAEARKRASEIQAKTAQAGAESMINIDEIKPVVMNWQDAWKSKNFDEHLSFYTTDAIVEKIFIRDNKEKSKSQFNAQQLRTEFSREFNPNEWEFTSYNTMQAPITYRFTRPSKVTQSKQNVKLYDQWLRELWFRKDNSAWKISHETWKIYEGVPSFR